MREHEADNVFFQQDPSFFSTKPHLSKTVPHCYNLVMFAIMLKIDAALESQKECTLVDKMGGHFHGILKDSWVRLSGGKMRGKVEFESVEKGTIQVDANDILDITMKDSK